MLIMQKRQNQYGQFLKIIEYGREGDVAMYSYQKDEIVVDVGDVFRS